MASSATAGRLLLIRPRILLLAAEGTARRYDTGVRLLRFIADMEARLPSRQRHDPARPVLSVERTLSRNGAASAGTGSASSTCCR
jgi:hypothetical protein